MLRLELNKIQKLYGSTEILRNLSITVADGEVIGLIGNNGAGKSTLCNIISGVDDEFFGDRNIYPGTIFSYFTQINRDAANNIAEMSVFEYVLDSQHEVLELESRYHESLRKITDEPQNEKLLKQFGDIQDQYMAAEAYNLIERIEDTLRGLGIEEHGEGRRNISWNSQLKNLSGGERKIVELATVLLNKKANLLILDEPTNHLDIEGRTWLEQYIKDFKGAVILVSHDRYLLNRLSQTIWEIENGTLQKYKGNYDKFEREKAEQFEAAIHLYHTQQKELKRLEEVVKELHRKVIIGGSPSIISQYNAMKSRVEKFKETMIENPMHGKQEFSFVLPKPSTIGYTAARFTHLTFSFDQDRLILDDASFIINKGDRVALLGANGAGKSTILKLILSQYISDHYLQPKVYGLHSFMDLFKDQIESGKEIYVGPSAKVAYYSQNHSQFDDSLTIRELLKDYGILGEGAFQSIVKRFKFQKDTVDTKTLGDLSGGEKSKVQFMLVMLSQANFLLLDEPINHLDINSMKAVEQTLADFKGTVMIISHDRYFLNKVINRIIYIKDCKVHDFYGNYDEFVEKGILKES